MVDLARPLLTIKDVAVYCRVSTRTVHSWITDGHQGRRLQAIKAGGAVRITFDAVQQWVSPYRGESEHATKSRDAQAITDAVRKRHRM